MELLTSNVDAAPDTVVLSTQESRTAEGVCQALASVANGEVNAGAWVRAASDAWHELPVSIRKAVGRFRRDPGITGTLLLRGFRFDEETILATPSVSGSVELRATFPAAMLMLTASGLGDPAAFLPEKRGALVQDVVPVPGKESFQGNEGSALLSLHTENAFHRYRPDYILLICLRADHERVAGLRVSSVREAGGLLSDRGRRALFRKEYLTTPPPSFGEVGSRATPHAILTGAQEDPDMTVDFAATTPLTRAARDALGELRCALDEVAQTIHLIPGDLAIVDNRIAVHGRTAFRPRYDGYDRWLQRTYSVRDLRRSRQCRPEDGHVLVS